MNVVADNGQEYGVEFVDSIHFIDVETADRAATEGASGVVEFSSRIHSIGMTERAKLYSVIDPEMPISPGATAIHGFWNADVEDKPTLREYLDVVLEGAHPYHANSNPYFFVAHNAPFDHRFLAPYLKAPAVLVDTLRLARRYMKDSPDHKLQTLLVVLGIRTDIATAHTAEADTDTLRQLFLALCEISGKTPLELCIDAQHEDPITELWFGKHKGMSLEVAAREQRGYLKWILSDRCQMEHTPHQIKAIEAALGY